MFQSLFYWILFFYLKLLKKYTEVTWRFNPYFTGFSSFIHARRHGQDDLQSCFNPYSIGFSSFIIWQMVCKNGERPCFNPYSIGFSSFIWAEYLRKNECTGVSILILLDSILLFKIPWTRRNIFIWFQSLFYWILFFYFPFLVLQSYSATSFNPYSTGFSSFIMLSSMIYKSLIWSFNPYSTGFSSFI